MPTEIKLQLPDELVARLDDAVEKTDFQNRDQVAHAALGAWLDQNLSTLEPASVPPSAPCDEIFNDPSFVDSMMNQITDHLSRNRPSAIPGQMTPEFKEEIKQQIRTILEKRNTLPIDKNYG